MPCLESSTTPISFNSCRSPARVGREVVCQTYPISLLCHVVYIVAQPFARISIRRLAGSRRLELYAIRLLKRHALTCVCCEVCIAFAIRGHLQYPCGSVKPDLLQRWRSVNPTLVAELLPIYGRKSSTAPQSTIADLTFCELPRCQDPTVHRLG